MDKVFRKLTKNLGGIKTMTKLPGIMFVIDSTKEDIAILEAQRLKIPVISIVDTNGDPDGIDFPIPGNDDALRAIELFTMKVSEAVLAGKKKKLEQELQETKTEEESTPEELTEIADEQSVLEEPKEKPEDKPSEKSVSVPEEAQAEKKEKESPKDSEKTQETKEGEN